MSQTSRSTLSGPPAMVGGAPAFPEGVPFVRPAVPDPEPVIDRMRAILGSGMLTNAGYVREFERASAEYLGVRHCIAVSSCTAGLMLVLRACDLSGDAVMPSFTFAATAHAAAWNGLRPVFADIEPGTLTLSAQRTAAAVGVRTSVIVATHTFGTPCDVDGLSHVAQQAGIRLVYDAAHAFGSRSNGRAVGGFGDAEVFSLSPTKVVVAGEGGIIATNNDLLAERCRIGRDYANPGDYDCRFVGLNARMSELHAAVALESLKGLEERIERRNEIARRYGEVLAPIPGITLADVRAGDRSTYKDFTILVDEDEFGCDAARLGAALGDDGVETRRYYAPPVHTMVAYRNLRSDPAMLPVTTDAASKVITLPLWIDLTDETIDGVGQTIARIHEWLMRSRAVRTGSNGHNGDGTAAEVSALDAAPMSAPSVDGTETSDVEAV